jgi:YggT family protein
MQLVAFLVDFVFDTYVFLLLLRLLFQKLGASWYNPLVRFCLQMTDPVVKPIRRFIPGVAGFDLSVLLLAWLFESLEMFLLILLKFGYTPHFLGLGLFAAISLAEKLAHIFIFSMIISAISSWFIGSHRNPLVEVAELLARPVVEPIRAAVPAIAGLDLSVMIGVFALYIVLQFMINPVLARAMQMSFFGA